MKRIIILLAIFIAAMLQIRADKVMTMDLLTLQETQKNVDVQPDIAIEEVGDTICVKVKFRYLSVITEDSGESRISIPGFKINMKPEEPQWLVKNVKYPIKDGYEIEVISSINKSVEIPMILAKAAEIAYPDNGLRKKSNGTSCSSDGSFCPREVVSIKDCQYYRGYGFIPMEVCPVQYNEHAGIVRVNNDFEYKIIYTPICDESKKVSHSQTMKLNIADGDTYLESIVYSTNGLSNNSEIHGIPNSMKVGSILPSPQRYTYLILTTSELYEAAEKLSNWKKLLGYNVIVSKRIGEWTVDRIKQRIKNTANQYPDIYYVLILGDSQKLPGVVFPHYDPLAVGNNFMSDFPYSCLDGDNDYTPDINIGRIPASNLAEANNAIEKIIEYERYPVLDESFYKKAFHIGEFSHNEKYPWEEKGMHSYTCEKATIAMQDKCGFNITRIYGADYDVNPQKWDGRHAGGKLLPSYLLRPQFNWEGSFFDVSREINNGSIYGLYRGHGSFEQWGYYIQYHSDDIELDLRNKGRYPLIFSMTCQSGGYNKKDSSMAKRFLTSKNKGAVGVIASTEIEYGPYSDVLTGMLLRSIWPQSELEIYSNFEYSYYGSLKTNLPDLHNLIRPEYHLGKALNNAQSFTEYIYDNYAADEILQMKRLFHCFGDPSMLIQVKAPSTKWDVTIKPEPDGFEIIGDFRNYPNGAAICVVDTVRDVTIAYEILQNKKIVYGVPSNCKICISGYGKKPLVVDGKDGYSIRKSEPMRIPQCADEYLDFSTGLRIPKDFDSSEDGYTCTAVGDGLLEIDIEGVFIFRDEKRLPGRELWVLKGGSDLYSYEGPAVPALFLKFSGLKGGETYNFELIDLEYEEYKDIDCFDRIFRACVVGWDLDQQLIYAPYEKYSGYWPNGFFGCNDTEGNFITSSVRKGESSLHLVISPFTYNCEDKVMRVCRKFKIKTDAPVSGISSTYAEPQEVRYYSIDGQLVNQPQKGVIYIMKKGSDYKKIVY